MVGHQPLELSIVVRIHAGQQNYLVGVAEIVAVGVAEVVAGIGVGKTNGICSILFKTFQSMLLYEIKPAIASNIKSTEIIIAPIGSF